MLSTFKNKKQKNIFLILNYLDGLKSMMSWSQNSALY